MTENTLNPESTDADNVVVEEVLEAPAVEETLPEAVEEAVAEEPTPAVVVEEPVAQEVVADPAVIVAPEPVEAAPAITSVADGVIGTGKVAKKKAAPAKAAPVAPADKVAIFSTRNIHWQGLGKIVKGYNIVSKSDAEKWVTVSGVKLATPEEIKTNLG
jgi:hypothetical protein